MSPGSWRLTLCSHQPNCLQLFNCCFTQSHITIIFFPFLPSKIGQGQSRSSVVTSSLQRAAAVMAMVTWSWQWWWRWWWRWWRQHGWWWHQKWYFVSKRAMISLLSGNDQSTFWQWSVYFLAKFSLLSGNDQSTFWQRSVYFLAKISLLSGNFWQISWWGLYSFYTLALWAHGVLRSSAFVCLSVHPHF